MGTVILSVVTGWEASSAGVVHRVPQSFTSEKNVSWWTPANKRSRWLPLPVSTVTQRSVACCGKSINATARSSSQLQVTRYSSGVATPFDLLWTWPLRPLGWLEVAAKVSYLFELLRDVRHRAANCLHRLTKERRHDGGTDDLEPRGRSSNRLPLSSSSAVSVRALALEYGKNEACPPAPPVTPASR